MHILVVDDHDLFTEGMRRLLVGMDANINIEIAPLLSDAARLLATGTFDLVLLDLNLPDANGTEGLNALQKINADVPIVIVSADNSSTCIRMMIDQGAKGYIPKTTNYEVMIQALKLVLAKGVYLPPQIFNAPLATNLRPQPPERSTPSANPVMEDLTARQTEVLRLVIQGKSNKTIAKLLVLSNATVKAHLTTTYRKLGVSSRTEAIFAAAQMEIGLL